MIKLNTKKQIKALLGSDSEVANILGITRQGFQQWPARLTDRQKNEILGAVIRSGKIPHESLIGA